jgi:N-methylhydantoinase B
VDLEPDDRLHLNPPGGAGCGDPRSREPELVLQDVVDGYVSLEAAECEYGVRVRYTGPPEALVRTPDLFEIDAVLR